MPEIFIAPAEGPIWILQSCVGEHFLAKLHKSDMQLWHSLKNESFVNNHSIKEAAEICATDGCLQHAALKGCHLPPLMLPTFTYFSVSPIGRLEEKKREGNSTLVVLFICAREGCH